MSTVPGKFTREIGIIELTISAATTTVRTQSSETYARITVTSTDTLDLEYYPLPSNLPDLTTIFTPGTGCAEKFVAHSWTWVDYADSNYKSTVLDGAWSVAPPYGNMPIYNYNLSGPSPYPDDSYFSCQALYISPTYSPGVCVEGHTLAKIVEVQYNKQTRGGTRYWEGKCCRRYENIKPLISEFSLIRDRGMAYTEDNMIPGCRSHFSTPFRALTTLTWTDTVIYEGDSTSLKIASGLSYLESINITTMSTGIAVADPISVAWNEAELSLFPTAYASSVAQQIGVSFNALPSPGFSFFTPAQTNLPPASTGSTALGTRVIAGISVGIITAAVILSIGIFLFISGKLRRRRKPPPEGNTLDISELEDQNKKGRWLIGGRWRNEALADEKEQELSTERRLQELPVEERRHELECRSVFVVPGPPAELPALEKGSGITMELTKG